VVKVTKLKIKIVDSILSHLHPINKMGVNFQAKISETINSLQCFQNIFLCSIFETQIGTENSNLS